MRTNENGVNQKWQGGGAPSEMLRPSSLPDDGRLKGLTFLEDVKDASDTTTPRPIRARVTERRASLFQDALQRHRLSNADSGVQERDWISEESIGVTDRIIKYIQARRDQPVNDTFGKISQWHFFNLVMAFSVNLINNAASLKSIMEFPGWSTLGNWAHQSITTLLSDLVILLLFAGYIKELAKIVSLLFVSMVDSPRGSSWLYAFSTHTMILLPTLCFSKYHRERVIPSAPLISHPRVVMFDLILADGPLALQAVVRVMRDLTEANALLAVVSVVSMTFHLSKYTWLTLMALNRYGQQQQRIKARRMSIKRWATRMQVTVGVIGVNDVRVHLLQSVDSCSALRCVSGIDGVDGSSGSMYSGAKRSSVTRMPSSAPGSMGRRTDTKASNDIGSQSVGRWPKALAASTPLDFKNGEAASQNAVSSEIGNSKEPASQNPLVFSLVLKMFTLSLCRNLYTLLIERVRAGTHGAADSDVRDFLQLQHRYAKSFKILETANLWGLELRQATPRGDALRSCLKDFASSTLLKRLIKSFNTEENAQTWRKLLQKPLETLKQSVKEYGKENIGCTTILDILPLSMEFNQMLIHDISPILLRESLSPEFVADFPHSLSELLFRSLWRCPVVKCLLRSKKPVCFLDSDPSSIADFGDDALREAYDLAPLLDFVVAVLDMNTFDVFEKQEGKTVARLHKEMERLVTFARNHIEDEAVFVVLWNYNQYMEKLGDADYISGITDELIDSYPHITASKFRDTMLEGSGDLSSQGPHDSGEPNDGISVQQLPSVVVTAAPRRLSKDEAKYALNGSVVQRYFEYKVSRIDKTFQVDDPMALITDEHSPAFGVESLLLAIDQRLIFRALKQSNIV